VAQDDDHRHPECADREFQRAEHGGVDHLAGGANHEDVAETLVEDQLGRDPAVTTTEHRGGGLLTLGQALPMLDALVRVFRMAGGEALVTLFE
jgi:hypothetical protein